MGSNPTSSASKLNKGVHCNISYYDLPVKHDVVGSSPTPSLGMDSSVGRARISTQHALLLLPGSSEAERRSVKADVEIS